MCPGTRFIRQHDFSAGELMPPHTTEDRDEPQEVLVLQQVVQKLARAFLTWFGGDRATPQASSLPVVY